MSIKIKKIKDINYEKIKVKGELYVVGASDKDQFNFPYTLFIPENIDRKTSLIVEGANTGKSRENINAAINDVIYESMDRMLIEWNSETNFPILTPCFPRIYTKEDGGIYTHMLSSKALFYKKHNLERIDIQLTQMIKHAISLLSERQIEVDNRVILDGFSASAKFVNRFALLHPEIVKVVIGGACSGTGILPIRSINGEKLIYPIGCGDLEEVTDDKIEAFKAIKHFYYMGELDPLDNDPLGEKEDGSLISESSITREEAEQLYKYVGKKMMPDRWNRFQEIYKDLGVNATFETYEGYGHNPTPAGEEVKQILLQEKKQKQKKFKLILT